MHGSMFKGIVSARKYLYSRQRRECNRNVRGGWGVIGRYRARVRNGAKDWSSGRWSCCEWCQTARRMRADMDAATMCAQNDGLKRIRCSSIYGHG